MCGGHTDRVEYFIFVHMGAKFKKTEYIVHCIHNKLGTVQISLRGEVLGGSFSEGTQILAFTERWGTQAINIRGGGRFCQIQSPPQKLKCFR